MQAQLAAIQNDVGQELEAEQVLYIHSSVFLELDILMRWVVDVL